MRSVARLAVPSYALIAYAAFGLATAWAVGFLVGAGAPTSVDGPAARPALPSLAIDLTLLLAFAVHHSVAARAGFKRRLVRVVPAAAERSTFVLVASLLLVAVLAWWQPVPAVVWQVPAPWSAAVWAVQAVGWVLVVWSTFMVDHADFVGLKQAFRHLRRRPYTPPAFTERRLYAVVRHPMMLGLLLAFWAAPRMTAGHLAFALASTAYIAVGVRFEERALRAALGREYEDYARRVPAVVPVRRPTPPGVGAAPTA